MKCLAKDKPNVEELVVPDVSYTSIFTAEWLNRINGERTGAVLENCLLATNDRIFRVPWEKIINPEFINKPKRMENESIGSVRGKSPTQPQNGPTEVGPPICYGPNLLRGSRAVAITTEPLARVAASSERESLQLGEDTASNLGGEYVALTDVSFPTQAFALSCCTTCGMRAKSRPADSVAQDSHACLMNGICPALASMPHSPANTACTHEIQPADPEACAMGSDPLLLKNPMGTERNPTPAFPTLGRGTQEPPHGKLEAQPEHELDWRYAMCSYNDGEEAECHPRTRGRNGSEVEKGQGEQWPSTPSTEAMRQGGDSSPARGGESNRHAAKALPSGSHVGHSGAFRSSEDDDSGKAQSPKPCRNVFLPPPENALPSESYAGARVVAHSPPSQDLLVKEITDHYSDRLPCGRTSPKQVKLSVGLDSRDNGEAAHPRTAPKGLPVHEKESRSAKPLPIKGQTEGHLPKENGGACQQQEKHSLGPGPIGAMQGSLGAKQIHHLPSAETHPQAEGSSVCVNEAGATACQMDQISLPRRPNSNEVGGPESLLEQRLEKDYKASKEEEPDTQAFTDAGCKIGPLQVSEQLEPSNPAKERTASPSAPRVVGRFPETATDINNGDPEAALEAFPVRGRAHYDMLCNSFQVWFLETF